MIGGNWSVSQSLPVVVWAMLHGDGDGKRLLSKIWRWICRLGRPQVLKLGCFEEETENVGSLRANIVFGCIVKAILPCRLLHSFCLISHVGGRSYLICLNRQSQLVISPWCSWLCRLDISIYLFFQSLISLSAFVVPCFFSHLFLSLPFFLGTTHTTVDVLW